KGGFRGNVNTDHRNEKRDDQSHPFVPVIRLGLGVLVHPVGVMFTILPNPPLKRRVSLGSSPI
ncbi:MAG: hypothetical protein IJZ09_00470, partial [Tidjanibacter sp.]|nr:hypothetical protein [Tidjanibacter sp.]